MDQIYPINMLCIQLVCTKPYSLHYLQEQQNNIVTKNQKTLKILPATYLPKFAKIAWPKIRKRWVNPEKCERRKKAIPTHFTKINVIKAVKLFKVAQLNRCKKFRFLAPVTFTIWFIVDRLIRCSFSYLSWQST